MILGRIQKYLDTYGKQLDRSLRDVFFLVPPSVDAKQLKALANAAKIAEFNIRGFVTSTDAVASVYALKRASDDGSTKHVVFADMGLTHFTLCFAKINKEGSEVCTNPLPLPLLSSLLTITGALHFQHQHWWPRALGKNFPSRSQRNQQQVQS